MIPSHLIIYMNILKLCKKKLLYVKDINEEMPEEILKRRNIPKTLLKFHCLKFIRYCKRWNDFTLGFFFLPRVLCLFCLFFLRRVSFGNVIRFVLRRLPPTAGGSILSVKYIVAEGAGNFVNKVAYRI